MCQTKELADELAKSLKSQTTTDKALEAARRLREVDKDIQTEMVDNVMEMNQGFPRDHDIGPAEDDTVGYDSKGVSGDINFYKKEVDTLRSQVNQLEIDKSALEEKLRAVSRSGRRAWWSM